MADGPGFFTIRENGGGRGGGGGGGRDSRNPPPPPPPPGGPGGGQRPPGHPPRPVTQTIMPRPPQGMAPQQMAPQQMPPVPGRDVVPMRFQQRPPIEICDIRRERMTETEVREELSDYHIFRFEKVMDEDGYDIDGRRIRGTWKNVVRTKVQDISKADAVRDIRRLNRDTQGVTEKKRSLNPDQQRQLEKAREDLAADERDPRYHIELAQIDHQLKPFFDFSYRRDGHRRTKSRDRKKKWQRISLTAYYRRCPRPEENPFLLQREREMRMNIPPQHQQAFLAQQHHQQQQMIHHQQQQQQQQQQGGQFPPPPPRGFNGPPPNAKVGKPAMKPQGSGKDRIRVIHESDSDGSDSDSSCSGVFSSNDDSHDSRTDSTMSFKAGRHGRKGKPYLEGPGPGHFGVKPHAPIRRHSRHEDNYTHELLSPRFVPPAPVPPRVPALLPAADVEQLKVEYFELGKNEGRAEGRVVERIENRLAEDEAVARAIAYKPRTAPPPRVIQRRRSGVRLVTPSDAAYELEEDRLNGFERLRVDDRYPEEVEDVLWREDARRRRQYDRQTRTDEAIALEEQLMREEQERELQRREFDRRRIFEREQDARDYMGRRESSPGLSFSNPFTPIVSRPTRRASVSYTGQGRYYP